VVSAGFRARSVVVEHAASASIAADRMIRCMVFPPECAVPSCNPAISYATGRETDAAGIQQLRGYLVI
jgi:hypothetical protein